MNSIAEITDFLLPIAVKINIERVFFDHLLDGKDSGGFTKFSEKGFILAEYRFLYLLIRSSSLRCLVSLTFILVSWKACLSL